MLEMHSTQSLAAAPQVVMGLVEPVGLHVTWMRNFTALRLVRNLAVPAVYPQKELRSQSHRIR
ncbi:hypothetical protein E2C01_053951 [Portunus trituberculatus]|uniref:Uncharacterized protein n=1 Tax=Portunus trituberculatus TaxID=210409 RepID=A0A5B7GI13_PORTR|nr:hypothetical protein [Portunus trituberculatus]